MKKKKPQLWGLLIITIYYLARNDPANRASPNPKREIEAVPTAKTPIPKPKAAKQTTDAINNTLRNINSIPYEKNIWGKYVLINTKSNSWSPGVKPMASFLLAPSRCTEILSQ